jgi:hypothetical protein
MGFCHQRFSARIKVFPRERFRILMHKKDILRRKPRNDRHDLPAPRRIDNPNQYVDRAGLVEIFEEASRPQQDSRPRLGLSRGGWLVPG